MIVYNNYFVCTTDPDYWSASALFFVFVAFLSLTVFPIPFSLQSFLSTLLFFKSRLFTNQCIEIYFCDTN